MMAATDEIKITVRGTRRPRRVAASQRRPGGRRGARHHRAADHRQPQRRAGRRAWWSASARWRPARSARSTSSPTRCSWSARCAPSGRQTRDLAEKRRARDRHQGRRGLRRARRSRVRARLPRHRQQRARSRVRGARRRAPVRQGQRDHRPRPDHGRRGLLLHAAGAPGRLRVPRPGRRPAQLLPAQSELRFQRRGHSARRRLSRRAGRGQRLPIK